MTKKGAQNLAFISTTTLIASLIFLWLGIIEGISIRGKWFERILFFIYIFSTFFAQFKLKKVESKKIKNWIRFNLITPIIATLAGFIFSPILMLHLYFAIFLGLFTESQPVFENESYVITHSLSLMTNESYNIILKKGLIEKRINVFNTGIDFKKANISIEDNYFVLEDHGYIEKHKIQIENDF